uniref:SP-RING-type domain-containing protein n=1 Tax=Dunaliella tertiolecta TaxID=3047 RepID=A0A7S3QT71_DUNTE|mmetsp:Transcript_14183/g.38428  ORF Transcript_14183/g.38428 Transcript_14183/m.38428 type:complete len:291 (+) Transcript_14183:35-907(+)
MPRHTQSQPGSSQRQGSQSQSQRESQHVPTQPVIQEGLRLSDQHAKIFKKNLEFVQLQLKEIASTFADDNQADKVEGLRQSAVSVLKLEHEVKAYLEAMSGFTRGSQEGNGGGYLPDATHATDFGAELEAAAEEMLQSSQFELGRSRALQDFDEATNSMGKDSAAAGEGTQGPGAGGGGEDDDDIVMGGGNQELLNNRCPITQKSVFELEQPVEDQYGYIYEHQAIRATLANHAQRGQPCSCPIAGTAHRITVADLRPSERIKRARRRAMLQRGTQAGNTQQQENDVYDV